MHLAPPPYPLPPSGDVPVRLLGATFRSTTNSYKYLWLLALVDVCRERDPQHRGRRVPVNQLLARMLSIAWYPIRQFRLSFGAQDKIERALADIAHAPAAMTGQVEVPDGQILSALESDQVLRDRLARYVPYRFLAPWFGPELRGQKDARKNLLIRDCSAGTFTSRDCPPVYRFQGNRDEVIDIHPGWAAYLYRHAEVVAGFARWNLVRYLEARNPGVPNIAGKLLPPEARRLARPRKLWREVLEQPEPVSCIYTGRTVLGDAFSLDHFVPWSFVAHDLLWNLVPVPRDVNSEKGDHLPSLERHLPAFTSIQRRAFHLWRGHATAIEEFVNALRETPEAIGSWDEKLFEARLRAILVPLLETARNRGFQDWQTV